MSETVHVRELAAWGLDDYPYRPSSQQAKCEAAACAFASKSPTNIADPGLPELTQTLAELLTPHTARPDLHAEVAGLPWSLGIVDLRLLQAFQRRLSLSQHHAARTIPAHDDWPALIDFCLAPSRPVSYQREDLPASGAVTLTTCDPNLRLRFSDNLATPVILDVGSPFLEVALYRNRWFLRDGYHRAFALMKDNIVAVPAVIVTVHTLADLGADDPRFFPEPVLLSSTPPFVHHFLEDNLTIEYERPALLKTIRITIAETFAPAIAIAPNGEPA